VKLVRDDGLGQASIVCWLEADKRLKKGVRLTLKDNNDPNTWWTVDAVYDTMERLSIQKVWDAGGIVAKHY
jgi:hypothetical protein